MSRARSARGVKLLVAFACSLAMLGGLAPPTPTSADPGDIGYEGPAFTGVGGNATGEKPESKLWWNDGTWWGSLWDASTSSHRIHRLDIAAQTWVSTSTALDPRANSRADVLWVAETGKLYVASHVYTSSGSATSVANSARLYRYSYSSTTDQYALDAGFPVLINAARSEALVIDRDSSGQLWATWVQGGQVMVNRTVCDPTCSDASWGVPFVPAVNGVNAGSTTVSTDDISSLIAFGGGRIGLMWGNQNDDAWYFAVHHDDAGDTSWDVSDRVLQGADEADDHVNLATLLAGDDGRIFVAVKTSRGSASAPSIRVLERAPGTGGWTSHLHSTRQYRQTRPIVLLDETSGLLHVFTTDEGGGGVYHKSTPISDISFSDGKGQLVLWDDSAPDIDNVTSTKQNLTDASGLVILASNATTGRYWHAYDPLDGPPSGGSTVTFTATADAKVGSDMPTRNYGTVADLRVRTAATNSWNSYLRFNVSGLSGAVTSATLRLYVTGATASGGSVYGLPGAVWTETGITWGNAPAMGGAALDTRAAVGAGTWVEWDVTAAVGGNGLVDLGLRNGGGSGTYSSREGANPPQLVVTTSGPGQPTPPVAGFSAAPTAGQAPLLVTFTDGSSGTPTSWAWDFDANGTTDSTASNPMHTYTVPGIYSVTLTVANGAGSDSETLTGYIEVGGGGGSTVTFTATADAKVGSDMPTRNYGTVADLRVRTAATNSWNSYLRFNVSGLSGAVTSATLRLYVTGATASGGSVYGLPGAVWTETGITWGNAPAMGGAALDTRAAVGAGTWVEWDVTAAVGGNGLVDLGLRNGGGSGTYSSREGANPPQLVVTTSG